MAECCSAYLFFVPGLRWEILVSQLERGTVNYMKLKLHTVLSVNAAVSEGICLDKLDSNKLFKSDTKPGNEL